jgi:exonuclease VII small subunit
MLGARETRTVRLEEAVAAYRAALEERTRARVPLKWAATESNLAKVLQILRVRERGTDNLEEADAAYGRALEVFTRERSPMQSAVNVGGQGLVLMAIAERKADAATADEAVAKINESYQALLSAGQTQSAGLVAAQLANARALADRLRAR